MREMMPEVIRIDAPLPIPRSVTCSPRYMMKAEPLVNVRTVSNRNGHPGKSTICNPPKSVGLSSQRAMKND